MMYVQKMTHFVIMDEIMDYILNHKLYEVLTYLNMEKYDVDSILEPEVKPQALEKLFSECAGVPFQVSVDNLSGIEVDRAAFDSKVSDQLFDFLRTSLPTRAKVFAQALCRYYQRPWPSVESLAN